MCNYGMIIRDIRLENARTLARKADEKYPIKGLAEKLGKSSALISNYIGKTPTKMIGDQLSREIEDKFMLPVGWMDTPHLVAESSATYQLGNATPVTLPEQQKRNDVPLLTWVSAGVWLQNQESFSREDAERWMPCPIPHGEMTFALKVEGDSMTSPYPNEKSYPHGTMIYVDPERSITNGCRVVAWLPEQSAYTFKRYVEDAGRKYLKPLNPTYETIQLIEGIEICGVVIGSFFEE